MLGSRDDPRWDDPNWIAELDISVYPFAYYYYWKGNGEVPAQYREKADASTQTIVPFQSAICSKPSLLAARRRRQEEEREELAMMEEEQKNEQFKDKKINT